MTTIPANCGCSNPFFSSSPADHNILTGAGERTTLTAYYPARDPIQNKSQRSVDPNKDATSLGWRLSFPGVASACCCF